MTHQHPSSPDNSVTRGQAEFVEICMLRTTARRPRMSNEVKPPPQTNVSFLTLASRLSPVGYKLPRLHHLYRKLRARTESHVLPLDYRG